MQSRDWNAPSFTMSDDGTFTLESPPGNVGLWAFDDDLRRASLDLPLAPGEEVAGLVLELGAPPPVEPYRCAYQDGPPDPFYLTDDPPPPPHHDARLQFVDERGDPIDLAGVVVRTTTHLSDELMTSRVDGKSTSVERRRARGRLSRACVAARGCAAPFVVCPREPAWRAAAATTSPTSAAASTPPVPPTPRSKSPRCAPLPTRVGRTLYVEIYSGRSRTDGTSPPSISMRQ